MNHTEVKTQLPFRICDRCQMMDVTVHVSAVRDVAWHENAPGYYCSENLGTVQRNIIISCRNAEICERLYRMISEEIEQARSGGDGVDKTMD